MHKQRDGFMPSGFDVRPVIWASDPRRAMPDRPKDAAPPVGSPQKPTEQILWESATTVQREGWDKGNPTPPKQ
jgi:hypothetical protein